MKSVGYTIVAFVAVMAAMIWLFDTKVEGAFGFTFAIMAIAVISDLIRKKIEHKGKKAGKTDLVKIQTDLKELKKGMAELREYVTDIYIQQHEKKLE